MPAGRDVGQRAGRDVGLGPRPREVEPAGAVEHRRGAEALVGGHLAAERGRERADVRLERNIELARDVSEHDVPYGTTHEPGAVRGRGDLEEALPAGALPERVDHDGCDHRPQMIPRTRRTRVLVAAFALLLLVAGAFVAWALTHRHPADVSNPDVAFTAPTTAAKAPAPDPKTLAFEWPIYGYTTNRARSFPLAAPARPPFVQRWAVRGSTLLEFGPVAGGSSLYVLKNNGALYAIKRRTGVVYWKKKLGNLAASSPAYRQGVLFCTILEGAKGSSQGRVVAFNVAVPAASAGRARCRAAPSPRRSSSATRSTSAARTGPSTRSAPTTASRAGRRRSAARSRAAWRTTAASSSSATTRATSRRSTRPAGASSGRSTAARAPSAWAAGSSTRRPRSPSAASISGNTNGSVYSFSEKNGALAWRTEHRRTTSTPPAGRRLDRRASGRRSTSVPTTARCTRSTHAPATCAGSTTPRGRSPAASS